MASPGSRIRRACCHLVILDVMMRKMSGTELLEKIREFDDDIAVIVATGFPTVESAVASLKNAASDYVRKPLEPPVFVETVKRVLDKKGITRDPSASIASLYRIASALRMRMSQLFYRRII